EIPEAFYTGVFGWKTMTADMGEMRYTSFILDDKPIAGMYEKGEPEKKSPNHWRIYFAVDNCDEMAEKASSLGAKMVMPPMDIPDVGRMSIILDPQGGEFAIIKLLQNE
ncbi:MAG: VOC family protein, partial [Methanobacteriota archaeon]